VAFQIVYRVVPARVRQLQFDIGTHFASKKGTESAQKISKITKSWSSVLAVLHLGAL
jgi:hypothetical protein